jgi:hypothetical protein
MISLISFFLVGGYFFSKKASSEKAGTGFIEVCFLNTTLLKTTSLSWDWETLYVNSLSFSSSGSMVILCRFANELANFLKEREVWGVWWSWEMLWD